MDASHLGWLYKFFSQMDGICIFIKYCIQFLFLDNSDE